jgi:hypothetical protein
MLMAEGSLIEIALRDPQHYRSELNLMTSKKRRPPGFAGVAVEV